MATFPTLLSVCDGQSCPNGNFTDYFCRSSAGKVARMATFPTLLSVCDGQSCPNGNFTDYFCRSSAGKVARMTTFPTLLSVCDGQSCPNSNFTDTFAGLRRIKLPAWQLYRHFCRPLADKAARMATLPAFLPVCGGKSCPNGNFFFSTVGV
ncbi:hypothetical protein GXP70_22620 [Paenibacillus lycopersici]|uniref:Uncharacterized protein n=1 Tax=Paenibacillus lycopersici TaxID=2704462 RepID=A0A6C0G3C4_9BACL|nr:hypothetical protein [Paenibacillus lycopersici]QHT62503.1 hypothetical protein GXP70_22620 [Paenibacillus lycopersici]